MDKSTWPHFYCAGAINRWIPFPLSNGFNANIKKLCLFFFFLFALKNRKKHNPLCLIKRVVCICGFSRSQSIVCQQKQRRERQKKKVDENYRIKWISELFTANFWLGNFILHHSCCSTWAKSAPWCAYVNAQYFHSIVNRNAANNTRHCKPNEAINKRSAQMKPSLNVNGLCCCFGKKSAFIAHSRNDDDDNEKSKEKN